MQQMRRRHCQRYELAATSAAPAVPDVAFFAATQPAVMARHWRATISVGSCMRQGVCPTGTAPGIMFSNRNRDTLVAYCRECHLASKCLAIMLLAANQDVDVMGMGRRLPKASPSAYPLVITLHWQHDESTSAFLAGVSIGSFRQWRSSLL
jgi:hypothetical protein